MRIRHDGRLQMTMNTVNAIREDDVNETDISE